MKKITLILLLFILTVCIYYFYPEKKLPDHIVIDKIIVFKSEQKLLAYSENKLVKTYKIAIGRSSKGRKQFEGDNKTPEGIYTINDKNPNSAYHKNLGISYPNTEDRENAKNHNKSAGGEIKIHGMRNGMGFIGKFHRWANWTRGCIAVTNEEMNELYFHTSAGTKIEILP